MFIDSSVALHPRGQQESILQEETKVIVPKRLVPDNATLPASTSGERRSHGPTQSSRILVKESTRAGLALRKSLFAEAMLENSSTRPRRRARDFVVSATVQLLLLAMLLLLPLYFTEALDTHQLNPTLLVPTPPAAPPPPAASTRSIAPKRKVSPVAGKLLAPTVIPHRIAHLSEERDASDLAPAILPGDGVPGGVPGGQPGGVIGGVLSGAAPPAPAPVSSAPKGPIRVGHGVKAPRIIFAPNPVYPVLARQAKISGAVVIDAVIDTQGNVVEMRTVSGQQILALAAMEALRHWKYEPTILGGEAIPVELLVTITFVPKGPQA
jgi:periplasmic protein TonB